MSDSQAHPDPAAPSAEGEPGVVEQSADIAVEPEWPEETPEPQYATMTLIGCTVACHDQLPAARVLRDSFLRRHPAGQFVLLLVDRAEVAGELEDEIITPADLGVDATEFARLAAACTAEQFRAVLRPRLLDWLVRRGATVLYLEPSVQVFGDFEELLWNLHAQCPLALVPRVLRPLLVDGLRPSVTDLAESGAFDPSVFAVCPGAEHFLAAWSEQLRADPSAVGRFLDGAPALVDHYVVRDPGVGLSVWNAGQRNVWEEQGTYTVDGFSLRSVHFAGFQPQRPWLLSATYADRPRVLLSEHPVLASLCAAYRNALVEAGYTTQRAHPFDVVDGAVLPNALRGEYLRRWHRAEREGKEVPPSPFEPGDAQRGFLEWAREPADERQRAAGGSRWTAAVWADDPFLRREYPDPFGADAEAFHEWCVGVGVASGRVPSGAVHQRLDGTSLSLVDQLGVAVLGSGQLADLLREAVRSSGLPSADTPYYPVVLRCDPEQPVPSGRHVVDIGPDAAAAASHEASEYWVLSEASQIELRRGSRVPVRTISVGLPDAECVDLPTRKGARARLGLSDEFMVGAFVDHEDERHGNVLGLVTAFFAAFPDRQDVRLVIAVSGASERPEAAERLRLATVTDPRVLLIEEDAGDVVPVACDCVCSLHRSDGGLGGDRDALRLLGVAVRGIPVLAPDYGAVTELMGPRGARLVPCQAPGEPDLDAAAAALRQAADDPRGIAEFGLGARDHLMSEHNVSRVGNRLRERAEHAYRNWRTKWAADRRGQPDDPLRPLLVARHALHRTPDVGVGGGRNAMAPALRKAVLKALSHYDEHIRDILRSLVDGVEQTAAELLRRQYEADGGAVDFEAVRAEMAQLSHRQEQLGAQLVGSDDGLVRARADLADQHRRIRELEGMSTGDRGNSDALAERLDSLTGAVELMLDRVDVLEKERAAVRNQELEASLRAASMNASDALRRTDVLQRILLREHERNTGTEDGTTSPVLCDAGLLRLPSEDGMMLPWLSSHASWDGEVSALIDSLLEPDGVFVDVGAYVGYQTVRVLSRLGNSGAVVAVEPCARSRDLLRRNVAVNVPTAWADRLTVVESAAWDAAGELGARPASSWGIETRPVTEEDSEESWPVPSVRLDRELESRSVLEGLPLSVVHVDLGGCVHRVLGGLVRLLRRDKPSIVCSFTPSAIQQLGDDPAAALREFGTWGYELVPVGRTTGVSAAELLEAIDAAGDGRTVKLWLRPRGKGV